MVAGGVCAITIMMHSSSLCMQMAVLFAGAHGASLQNMVAVGVCANTVKMHGGSLHMQMAVQYAGALYAVQTHIIENFYNSLVQFQGGVSLEDLGGFPSGVAFCGDCPSGPVVGPVWASGVDLRPACRCSIQCGVSVFGAVVDCTYGVWYAVL